MENSNSNSYSKSNSNSRKLERNKNRMMMLERGVVGLSIVAAMNITKTSSTHDADIVSSANKAASNFRGTTTYGLFFASTLNKIGGTNHHFVSPTSYFLSSCNLCNKHLHGVDIFIYRGERAFCSAECRETHIRNKKEECYYREKCRGSGLMKPPLHSIPPCSPPPFSLPGIAAA